MYWVSGWTSTSCTIDAMIVSFSLVMRSETPSVRELFVIHFDDGRPLRIRPPKREPLRQIRVLKQVVRCQRRKRTDGKHHSQTQCKNECFVAFDRPTSASISWIMPLTTSCACSNADSTLIRPSVANVAAVPSSAPGVDPS